MPIHGFPGGVISSTAVTPSVNSASGVWTLDEQLQNSANWPGAPTLLSNSVRLRSSATAYMTRTPVSAGNQQKFTYSTWVKRGTLSSTDYLLGSIVYANSGVTNEQFNIFFTTSDTLEISSYANSGYAYRVITTQVFRDPSAWYHIVIAFDTTQTTDTNRVKVYVNGSQVTSFGTTSYPTQNYNTYWNRALPCAVGAISGTLNGAAWVDPASFFDGYMADVNFIDGQQLTPNYFGATDGATGVWEPANYKGTYGTNGFYLPMNKTVEAYNVDYLVVAGGGGGGATRGGGGGAGGLLTSSIELFQGTTYTVTVGAGGAGGTDRNTTPVSAGNNSVFSSITATGGGKGGNEDTASGTGGSGGGGGGGTAATSGSAGTSGQGSAGGNGNASGNRPGGGGGGASAVGGAASSTDGGAGGAGTASSITGSSVTYAGGGGGGSGATGGAGGAGGGGAGGNTGVVGGNGTANTGGGAGGGGFAGTGMAGGTGGSGVVILRILTTQYTGTTTGSPTVTTDGSYTVVKYTSSGSYTA